MRVAAVSLLKHESGEFPTHLQMTMRQPAAVAMRAAVSLVAMPPVPHCVPLVLVSTWREGGGAMRSVVNGQLVVGECGGLGPAELAAKHMHGGGKVQVVAMAATAAGVTHIQLGQVEHLIDGLGIRVHVWVGGEQVGHIREQEQPVSLHQRRHLQERR